MLVIVIKNACMNSRRNITSASSIRFGTPCSSLFQLCNHMSGFSCSFPVCNRSRRVSLSKSRIFGHFTKLQTISEIFSTHNFCGAVPGRVKKFILPLVNRSVSIAGVADLKMCCLVTDNNIGNRLLKKSTLIHIHYS